MRTESCLSFWNANNLGFGLIASSVILHLGKHIAIVWMLISETLNAGLL